MKLKLDVSFIKSVTTVFNELHSLGINLVYLGEFTHDITKQFTSFTENNLDRKKEEKNIKKKVYHVMVETLQNLGRHSDETGMDDKGSGKGLFMIGQKEEAYFIITANKVSMENKIDLEKAVNEVNSSTPEELKEMYKKQIKGGEISNKGGAGLGLIDIARKTGKKLEFQFLPLDDENYFFIFKVEIT